MTVKALTYNSHRVCIHFSIQWIWLHLINIYLMFLGILINLWHCCDVIMEGQVALVAAFSSSVLLGMGALWCSGQASWPIKHSNTMVVIPLTSRFGTVAGAESCCKKKISIAILYGDADFLFPAGVVTGWLTVACLCLTGQEQDVANSLLMEECEAGCCTVTLTADAASQWREH